MAPTQPEPDIPDRSDHEALLAEASFACETVQHVQLTGDWMPVAHQGLSDKVYAVTGGGGRLLLHTGRYDLWPGRVLIIPAGAVQQGFSDAAAPLEKHYIHFRSSTTATIHLLRFYPPPLCLTGDSAAIINDLCRQMLDEWQHRRPARQLALRSLLTQIMMVAYRSPAADHVPPDDRRGLDGELSRPTDDQYDAIRRAVAYAATHYPQSLALADLAGAAGLAPTYFNSLFSRLVGLPPMRFLESLRMRRAGEQLACGDTPIARIAASVGYVDPNHFSRAFKRHTGSSPSDYRAAAQPHRQRKNIQILT